ncbi:MAG: hypothetical protein IPJ49_28690 [Candidatus Obscuribacter sp.]|nr:hypothetical protein [Candidatus Obscuribacter sp.]
MAICPDGCSAKAGDVQVLSVELDGVGGLKDVDIDSHLTIKDKLDEVG